jgi:hypothetical protein
VHGGCWEAVGGGGGYVEEGEYVEGRRGGGGSVGLEGGEARLVWANVVAAEEASRRC